MIIPERYSLNTKLPCKCARQFYYVMFTGFSTFQQNDAFDVDNMTELNDRYGQLQGDNVLRHVASAMMLGCRKSDTCFRTGGDEFMIMLPDCDTAHAIGIAKKIADNVSSEAVPMGDTFVKVTVSVGIAAYQKGMDISELISLAYIFFGGYRMFLYLCSKLTN